MAAVPAADALAVSGLSHRIGGREILAGIEIAVRPGTFTVLLGQNGAGKTTLFSLIAGFLKPSSGTIKCLDVDVNRDIGHLRGKLSILPQDAAFQANVPVIEQMIFFCMLSGYGKAEAEAEAMRALDIVGLKDMAKKNARILSHGMTKRVGIAQAFLGKPEVVLLDEPTAGLDPVNARGIRTLIREFPHTGTLIVSSHDLAEVQEICSHVAILDRGKLVECAEVSSITQTGKKVRIVFARNLTDAELGIVLGVSGVKNLSGGMPGEYIIDTDPGSVGRKQEEVVADIVGKLAASGLVPKAVHEGESLERRFLQVTTPQR